MRGRTRKHRTRARTADPVKDVAQLAEDLSAVCAVLESEGRSSLVKTLKRALATVRRLRSAVAVRPKRKLDWKVIGEVFVWLLKMLKSLHSLLNCLLTPRPRGHTSCPPASGRHDDTQRRRWMTNAGALP